jgi:hypothetical protein
MSLTITFRVDETERDELVARAAREKVSLSDYIRVRLGLRGQGSQDDAEVLIDAAGATPDELFADHDRRLRALEDDLARRRAGAS